MSHTVSSSGWENSYQYRSLLPYLTTTIVVNRMDQFDQFINLLWEVLVDHRYKLHWSQFWHLKGTRFLYSQCEIRYVSDCGVTTRTVGCEHQWWVVGLDAFGCDEDTNCIWYWIGPGFGWMDGWMKAGSPPAVIGWMQGIPIAVVVG